MTLRAPFPWFGGKSRAASLIWARFGDVPNYVEPFAGSLAVLLSRPHEPRTETVNDLDCYLANFWRALQVAPDDVARWADAPVNEADLLARHRWLRETGMERIAALRTDPEHFDAKVAGWWVWGLCAWIGSGWCRHDAHARVPDKLPHLGDAGMGVHRPSQKLPNLGNAGRGVHRPSQKLPLLGNAGVGVHRPSQKLPHLGDAGRGVADYFAALAARLRRVRVACGDWSRVLGESVTVKHGMTAVLLDPPYSDDEHDVKYAAHSSVAGDVRAWALANGDNPLLRIALCGYAGEHEMPGWTEVPWKARGGYGSQADGRGRANAARERIWFSPHCLPVMPEQPSLLGDTQCA